MKAATNSIYRIVLFLLVVTAFIHAQEWVQKMDDPENNFYDTQQSFTDYWQGRQIERSSGWKQFKRWEYFMEPRVYPDGILPAPDAVAEAMESYRQTSRKNRRDEGDWQPLGPSSWQAGWGWNPGIGRVNCSAIDPNNANKIYLGAPAGGFWRSLDGGQSWETTTDDLPVLGVSSIAIDPGNSDIIYIGTGDGDAGDTYSIGVLKSLDGGSTWQTTGLDWNIQQTRRISKILIDPGNSNTVLAATNSGVYKSGDGGASWTQTRSGNFKDMEFKPNDPTVVYVCGTLLYRSVNGGDSFAVVSQGVPNSATVNRLALAVTPANPDYVYLLAGRNSDSGFGGLYRSEDAGQTFTQRSASPNILGYSPTGATTGGQSWYDLSLAASPVNADEIFAGGVNIWRSANGGSSWGIVAYWYYPETSIPYAHADIHALDFYPGFGGGILLAGTDGGLWQTIDNGSSWVDLSSGIQTSQFYRFSTSELDPDRIIGGTQDNGSNMMNDGIWTHVLGADGMEAIIDYSNPDILYAATQNGGINRSMNGGATFQGATGGISENGGWVTPYVIDPEDPEILYAGYQSVWKTTNRGVSWSSISPSFGQTLSILAIAPSDPATIYAGSSGFLYATHNGGGSWQNISSGLPSTAALTYLTISDQDPQRIWVSFSGFADGEKVYASADGGANWNNISGSLPNIPVNCVLQQRQANDALYIGTDNGIFYRRPSDMDWEPFNTNLPNVIVQELEINYTSGMIRAATYGRGIWESPIAPYGPVLSHNPLGETEDIAGPYTVEVNILPGSSPLLPDSLFVYYGSGGSQASRTPLVYSGSGNVYSGSFPGSGSAGEVQYYISTVDSLRFSATLPQDAPQTYFSFYAGPDITPPTITHEPLSGGNLLDLPLQISAQVIDNIALASVRVEFRVNSGAGQNFALTYSGENWNGNFPLTAGDVQIGDVVSYEIVALDAAVVPNEARSGNISFPIGKMYRFGNTPGSIIANNNPNSSVSDTLALATGETLLLRDLMVQFQATHGNIGDLSILLQAPDGSVIALMERPGHPANPLGNSGNDPDILFSDTAGESIEDITTGNADKVSGTFRPDPGLLSAFSGKAIDGDWILTVSDAFGPFSGSFDAWSLFLSMDNPTGIDDAPSGNIPAEYALHANYPNPFNPATTIRYDLPQSAGTELAIYNMLGQKVRVLEAGRKAGGSHQVRWDGRDDAGNRVASGIYFYRLSADAFVQTRKLLLLK